MPNALISKLLGPGRSGLRRGMFGLLAAPAVAVLIFPGLLLLGIYSDQRSAPTGSDIPLSSLLSILGWSYLVAAGVAIIVGCPIWLILRARRLESGSAYLRAGTIAGMIPYLLLDLLRSGFDVSRFGDLTRVYLPCALMGGGAALLFWVIAAYKSPLQAARDSGKARQEERS